MLKYCIWFMLIVPIWARFENEDFVCDDEDGKKIAQSAVCNGKIDCLGGSDELPKYCKLNSSTEVSFRCAYGGELLESQRCNNVMECWDNSDELELCICDDDEDCNCDYSSSNCEIIKSTKWAGNCSKGQIECEDGKCIDMSRRCDGVHDCSNGYDESVALCYDDCNHDNKYFQCGNGKCIDFELLCDNSTDCVDGADELPYLCIGDDGSSPNCSEPLDKKLQFTKDTKSYGVPNKRIVYPNMPAYFECKSRSAFIGGRNHSVCTANGTWAFELPECFENSTREIENDPDTNGTNGCPLGPLEDRPKMYRFSRAGRGELLEPPIEDNTQVLFECDAGLQLIPNEYKELYCNAKKWTTAERGPSCLNSCSIEGFSEFHAVNYFCSRNNTEIGCESSAAKLPGSKLSFLCHNGYKNVDKSSTAEDSQTAICQKDGTWSGNQIADVAKGCRYDCGVDIIKQNLPLAFNSSVRYSVNSTMVPWHVSIYYNGSTPLGEYRCGGTLISLDVVLTAAHCVTLDTTHMTFENWELFVKSGGNVRGVFDLYKLEDYTGKIDNYQSDLAVLKLYKKLDHADNVKAVCLPWQTHFSTSPNAPEFKVNTIGHLERWSSQNGDRQPQMVECERRNRTENECIGGTDDKFCLHCGLSLCPGDSGSGLIGNCDKHGTKCIFGVLSHAVGIDDRNNCSDSVVVTNIKENRYQKFIDSHID